LNRCARTTALGSPVDVVDAVFAQIAATDPAAWISVRDREDVRREAARWQRAIESGCRSGACRSR
jgi:hypothetical protein